MAQTKTNEYIFPFDPKSVGTAFTRACRLLGIQDLRFHDLRHEATSRLFERGYQIHEVLLIPSFGCNVPTPHMTAYTTSAN
jgi:integrase